LSHGVRLLAEPLAIAHHPVTHNFNEVFATAVARPTLGEAAG
jgi:hypothetical protein